MNTSFKDNNYLKIFLPDPWNYQNKVKPVELKNFYKLPREYAQNYTNFNLTSNFLNIIYLILYIIKKLTFSNLITLLPIYLSMLIKKGFKNYMLFFFFRHHFIKNF